MLVDQADMMSKEATLLHLDVEAEEEVDEDPDANMP